MLAPLKGAFSLAVPKKVLRTQHVAGYFVCISIRWNDASLIAAPKLIGR